MISAIHVSGSAQGFHLEYALFSASLSQSVCFVICTAASSAVRALAVRAVVGTVGGVGLRVAKPILSICNNDIFTQYISHLVYNRWGFIVIISLPEGYKGNYGS